MGFDRLLFTLPPIHVESHCDEEAPLNVENCYTSESALRLLSAVFLRKIVEIYCYLTAKHARTSCIRYFDDDGLGSFPDFTLD